MGKGEGLPYALIEGFWHMEGGDGLIVSRTSHVIVKGRIFGFLFFFIFFKFIYLFYYFFISGCVGSLLLHTGFSLVAVSRGYSSLWCTGFSLW